MVIKHGEILQDFKNNDIWTAGWVHLFPHGTGGPLDPDRVNPVTLQKWMQILLERRDSRWRKDRNLLFVVATIIFRREALANVQFKLRRRMTPQVAARLASITKADLDAMAAELRHGGSVNSTLAGKPEVRKLLQTMQSISHESTWTDHGKRRTRMFALSLMIQFGQPFFWLTINPADVHSPLVMSLAGVPIDLAGTCFAEMPTWVERLVLIANDPLASARFFHETVEAILACLLRCGANDGDGGVLGKVQAYIGMTEEQRKLTLHAHMLVWVYGFNGVDLLREEIGGDVALHVRLASYVGRIIVNQLMTEDEMRCCLLGEPEPSYVEGHEIPPPSCTAPEASLPRVDGWPESDDTRAARKDPLRVSQCAPAPVGGVLPPLDSGSNRDDESIRDSELCLLCLVEDGWALAAAANTHKCTHTCVKYAKKDENGKVLPGAECRFGYGEGGRPIVPASFVKNARAVVYADGRMEIGAEKYPSGCPDAPAAFSAEIARAKSARELAVAEGGEIDTEDDEFYVEVRRGSTHINSYNWAIQQSTRSNMDIKTTLGKGRDARGLVFYMLGYSTKSEQSVSILLSLYGQVVSRIQDDTIEQTSKSETARRMVQSCLTKQLSGTELGAPAAVCKIMGWSDAIQSHQPILCPVRPVCSWLQRNLGDEDEGEGVVITTNDGKLGTGIKAPMDYIHRCHVDDVNHDLHGMSYFTYSRLIRFEKSVPTDVKRKRSQISGETDRDEDSGDDGATSGSSTATGRTKAKSYPFVDGYDTKRRQIRRAVPVALNIMCEPPLRESQPEIFCRLMLLLFKPFFNANDLLPVGCTLWETTYGEMQDSDWDRSTVPLRRNIETMQKSKRAVAANRNRKFKDDGALMARQFLTDGDDDDSGDEGDPLLFGDDDDDDDSESIRLSGAMQAANEHAEAALIQCVKQGIVVTDVASSSADDNYSAATTSGSPDQIIRAPSAALTKSFLRANHTGLKEANTAAFANVDDGCDNPGDSELIPSRGQRTPEAYVVDMVTTADEAERTANGVLAADELNEKRQAANVRARNTDVGRTGKDFPSFVVDIADFFMLNEQQRQAFFHVAEAILDRRMDSMKPAIRLSIAGGAGSGKSYIVRAIQALVDCPSLPGSGPAEKLLVCAFQGKQASKSGGTTCHSIAEIGDGPFRPSSTILPDAKKLMWKGSTVLIIEEVSMISSSMLASIHIAAVAADGRDSDQPFAGKHVIILGDFSQLKPVGGKSLAYGFAIGGPTADPSSIDMRSIGGQALFLDMTHWVLLNGENNRFIGVYKDIMERVRLGRGTDRDVSLLNSRVVGNGTSSGEDCAESTFIVFRNKIRSIISMPFVRASCLRRGTTMFISRSFDKLKGAGSASQVTNLFLLFGVCVRSAP